MFNINPHPPVSAAIAGLRRQLATGNITDLSHFWQQATSLPVPLVTTVDGAADEREVTFLWRARHPLRGVYLRLNRVTDKEQVAKWLMTQIPATEIWTQTLRQPASDCGRHLADLRPDRCRAITAGAPVPARG